MADDKHRSNRRPFEPASPTAPVQRGERPWPARPRDPITEHQEHRGYLSRRAKAIGVKSLVVADLVDLVARLEAAKETGGERGSGNGIAAGDRLINIEIGIKRLMEQRCGEEET